MKILVATFCLDKAGSHELALALASELAKQHTVYFFNQNEQLVDPGMVAQYLSPAVRLVAMDRYPLFNAVCWKLNALFLRLGAKFSVHEKGQGPAGPVRHLALRHRPTAQPRAVNLAAELVGRGHNVVVFNQRDELIDRDLVQRLLPPEVKVLSVADKPLGKWWAHKVNAMQHRLGLPATFFERYQKAYLIECLLRYRIELIGSHATFSDRLCAPVAQRLRLPLVVNSS